MDSATDAPKHFRSVHLLFVAASFVLIVSATLAPPQRIERAFEQVQYALLLDESLQQRWIDDKLAANEQMWVSQQSQPASDWSMPHLLGEFLEFQLNGKPVFALQINRRQHVLYGGADTTVTPSIAGDSGRSFREFREMWDTLGLRRSAYALKSVDLTRIVVPPPAAKLGKWSVVRRGAKPGVCTLSADGLYIETELPDVQTPALALGVWTDESLAYTCAVEVLRSFTEATVIPLSDSDSIEVKLPIEEWVGEIAPRPAGLSGKLRPMNEAFYDLSLIAKDLETLKLAELRAYIDRLRSGASERVEVIGIQLPLGGLALWGSILLVALQSYLYVGIRRLRHLGLWKSDASEWVVMYPGLLSQGFVLATLILLPIVATTLLAIRTFQTHLGLLFSLTTLTCVVLLSTVGAFILHIVSRASQPEVAGDL